MTRTAKMIAICAGVWIAAESVSVAQNTTPAQTNAAAAPVKAAQELRYQVVEVAGVVRAAAIGVDPKSPAGWHPVQVGEFITAGMQINTTFRAKVKLVMVPADPPTVIMIERMTLVQFSELRYEAGAAKARIELGHGAVRAGVAEGSVRSDMQIASPAAVLSKKGTDIFRFWYYNGNDWGMSLSDRGRGLIQAIQLKQGGMTGGGLGGFNSRFVRPGQSVNQEMLRTIETELFNRFVNVNELFGLTNGDIQLISLWGNGINIRGLNGDIIKLRDITGRDIGLDQMKTKEQLLTAGVDGLRLFQNLPFQTRDNRPRGNNGGDFGIGQGTVPVSVFNTASKAVIQATQAHAKQQMLKAVVHPGKK